jgi:hypothetical protein
MEEVLRKAAFMDYVKGLIVTDRCALDIYHRKDLIQSFPYELPGHVYNWLFHG